MKIVSDAGAAIGAADAVIDFTVPAATVEHARVAAEKGVSEIGLDDYKKLGLASSKKALIKILGNGELTSAISISAHKFSKSAQEKIEKAGGKALLAGAPVAAA